MNAFDFPSDFRISDIATNGVAIHVRHGGTGPAVVLLYGETGDMWAPMASANPVRFSEAARTHYSKLYALPGAMHSGFTVQPDSVRDFTGQTNAALPVMHRSH